MIYVLRYCLIVLYTAFWSSLACLLALVDRSGESVIWVARRWVSWILRSCRIRVESEGAENVAAAQPVVLMSNHQSVFDVAAIVTTLPTSWRFVAKRDLTWIPLFGWALVAGGHVIIDRGHRHHAIESLARAAERVRRGVNVIVFPEGTRGNGRSLQEFKSGGFHLAIEAGVPILPVTVSGSQHITPRGSLRIESGTIHVRYGTPIPTASLGIDGRLQLKAAVREAIVKGFSAPHQRA